jgi:hypothetical protein
MRWTFGLSMALLLTAACMPRGPVVGTADAPPGVGGTISGTVRGTAGATGLAGRKVTATNLGTGEAFEASTSATGGYTMKVPMGRYRLDVELRANETLAEHPGELEINASDMDAGRDFVITIRGSQSAARAAGATPTAPRSSAPR